MLKSANFWATTVLVVIAVYMGFELAVTVYDAMSGIAAKLPR